MQDPNTILTNKEKNICEYGAGIGILLTLTCLIQHFIYVIPNSLTNSIIAGYFFAIIAFVLLGLQKQLSVWLVIASAAISVIIEYLWITHYSFSLVVMMLFIYHVVIVVLIFIEQIPRKLKLKSQAIKANRDLWHGKI